MATPLKQRIIEQIDALPVELQQHVLDFARALTKPVLKGIPGKSLLVFAGSIPEDDLQAMSDAIEAGCERVGDDW